MRNTVILLTSLFVFLSCKENTNTNTDKMSNLTSKNYIETMFNSIKRYDYEPIYFLTFVQNSCFSEILVNGIPVNKNFKKASQGLTLDINDCIFKSGIQKVTVRLYPTGKIGMLNLPTLVNNTEMKIDVTVADNKKRDLKGKEVATYATPLAPYQADGYEKTRFVATGKDYYEASFTFEAKVPYEFNSLEKGQDLTKWNAEKLEKKVVDFYKNQLMLLKEKKTEEYFSYLDLREKETRQSLYFNKKELQEILDSYLEAFTIPNYQMQPLENYKLQFYGDGKIVCLELTSQEGKMRGKSALWAKFDEGDGLMFDFFKFYLYIPEGEDELVMIR